MDESFIKAAFKSLDDLEKEENISIKRALRESRLKEQIKRKLARVPFSRSGEHLEAGVGDPKVSMDAFNHATSIGAGSPTAGLGESIEKKAKNKFNLNDAEDIKEAKQMKEDEPSEEDMVLISPLGGHSKPHLGDAILICKDCNKGFYFNKKDLVQSPEDPAVYNVETTCENCGGQDGYTYVADVGAKDSEGGQDAMNTRAELDRDDFDQTPADDLDQEVEGDQLEAIDTGEEPQEVVEESFDKLVNKYLTRIYENLSSYKTTSISQTGPKTYVVEGLITDTDGKELNSTFTLNKVYAKNGNVFLSGSNNILSEAFNPFKFSAQVKDKKMIFESMKYSYAEDIDAKRYLVEGLEIN